MKYPITTYNTLMVTLFAASQLQAGPDRGRHHGSPDAEMSPCCGTHEQSPGAQ